MRANFFVRLAENCIPQLQHTRQPLSLCGHSALRELPALIFWNWAHFKQIYVTMLLYNISNICKYTYYTYILVKCTKPSRICDCNHDSKVRRFMSHIQVHLTFIIQCHIYPKTIYFPVSDKLFYKLLLGLYFQ